MLTMKCRSGLKANTGINAVDVGKRVKSQAAVLWLVLTTTLV